LRLHLRDGLLWGTGRRASLPSACS
jgi:hypothetical protein